MFILEEFKNKYGARKFTWFSHFFIVILFSGLYYKLLEPNDFNGGEDLKDYGDYLYFTIITHASVGYGDISPKTPKARKLVTLHVVLAFVLIISLWL